MSNELKEGDLVMTEYDLAWLGDMDADGWWVLPIDAEKNTFYFTYKPVIKATREQIEQWALENKYSTEYRSNKWDKKGYSVIDDPVLGGLVLQPDLDKNNFYTAPSMQAEAILLAKMLNATKD